MSASIHASCVLIGQTGVLIRGASGAGKSMLAWNLIEAELNAGRRACLVADDRVLLSVEGDSVVARAPMNLAGLIELRGLGILKVAFAPSAVIGLVVDLSEEAMPRLPEPQMQVTQLEGVTLPRLAVPRAVAETLVRARLHHMTNTLFNRIEAIESFAADVAHELKNPLTSLRSAVEILPLARSETSRDRLLEVIQHDVRRLDRLISDISDASRLDAELLRAKAEPIDMLKLLSAVTLVFNSVDRKDGVKIKLTTPAGLPPAALFVNGHDSRLGQVVNNLIDNASSFTPQGGEVRVLLRRTRNDIDIVVEDDGPGVPEHALERIFERFYTDRPEDQGFGQNSGLGLSISRQIVEAHGGTIVVENRKDGERVLGARFTLRLPAAA
jgi:signal transduction histidine kinase